MEKLFGTDGIRGKANTYPIIPELILNMAKSVSFFLFENNEIKNNKVIIAKDTRASCHMIEASLAAGFTSMGLDVQLAGVLPTPGLSYVTKNLDADFSVMISASHNRYYDNGIKFFKGSGKKLTDVDQDSITKIYYNKSYESLNKDPGSISDIHEDSKKTYEKLFLEYCDNNEILKGLKIVLDTANGACYEIAESIFKKLGADIIVIHNNPSGLNINNNCGSEHTDSICEKVIEEKADFGLSFDGDGDRLIAIDDIGNRVTGDQILAVSSKILNDYGKKIDTIVSTVMSNLGLRKYFRENSINHIEVKVGDRYVYESMIKEGAKIGGEDSGHLIFLEYQNTGDGILSGVILSDLIKKSGQKLSQLTKILTIYPQKLLNIEVSSKPELDTITEIKNTIKTIETKLGDEGRVLVRYSGTENLCRVMVEGESHEITNEACEFIAKAVKRSIGK